MMMQIRSVALISMPFFIFSCADEQVNIDEENSGLSYPQLLRKAQLPASGEIVAYLTLDGSDVVEMEVTQSYARFEGSMSAGNHHIELSMDFDSREFGIPIPLVKAEKEVTIWEGSNNTIEFYEDDYTYIDSDGDAYNNIRELEAGFHPFSSSSTPDYIELSHLENVKITAYVDSPTPTYRIHFEEMVDTFYFAIQGLGNGYREFNPYYINSDGEKVFIDLTGVYDNPSSYWIFNTPTFGNSTLFITAAMNGETRFEGPGREKYQLVWTTDRNNFDL